MKKNKEIEYNMSKTAFQELLNTRTAAEMKLNPYVFVMKVLNETYGIKGHISRISLT